MNKATAVAGSVLVLASAVAAIVGHVDRKPAVDYVHPTIRSSADQTITPTARPQSSPIPPADARTCKVVRVVDGDTFHALCADLDITVRVIGIDTPETKDPRKKVQCYGPEASARAHELLDGKIVHLVDDPTQDETDRYGRSLAYAVVDGTDFGLAMIRGGYAREYSYDDMYERRGTYQREQRLAEARKTGLWAAC